MKFCPMKLTSPQPCLFVKIPGSVRDFPSVGVRKCVDCGIVTHEEDLSGNINYVDGSMHNWAAGHGENAPKQSQDLTRRIHAISDFCRREKLQKVLDFGCGDGNFVEEISKNFQTVGIEPEIAARKAAIDRGLQIFENSKSLPIEHSTFDLVSLFHVIEHLYEPLEVLGEINRNLNPGGYLVIETPNSNDALLTVYESSAFQNWTYWSHHPYLYSSKSLGGVVTQAGFEVIHNGGIQRYSLANHLHWLARSKPGGHEVWKNICSDETSRTYDNDRVNSGTSDTLWLIARKN